MNIGVSDNVRKLCATVPLKGRERRAAVGWIHWWSPVDSANKSSLLAELHPFGGAQRTSDEIEQVGWFLETNCHQFPCAAMTARPARLVRLAARF